MNLFPKLTLLLPRYCQATRSRDVLLHQEQDNIRILGQTPDPDHIGLCLWVHGRQLVKLEIGTIFHPIVVRLHEMMIINMLIIYYCMRS